MIAVAALAWYFRKYPNLIQTFKERADTYNASVRFIQLPPSGVRIREIAPPQELAVGRTTQDETALRESYKTGIARGEMFMKEWASQETLPAI